MTILLLLIPLGLVLLGVAIAAFAWAVRHGQFENLEGEGARILFDDPPAARPAPTPAPGVASDDVKKSGSQR